MKGFSTTYGEAIQATLEEMEELEALDKRITAMEIAEGITPQTKHQPKKTNWLVIATRALIVFTGLLSGYSIYLLTVKP